jgi:hypothetical protein
MFSIHIKAYIIGGRWENEIDIFLLQECIRYIYSSIDLTNKHYKIVGADVSTSQLGYGSDGREYNSHTRDFSFKKVPTWVCSKGQALSPH